MASELRQRHSSRVQSASDATHEIGEETESPAFEELATTRDSEMDSSINSTIARAKVAKSEGKKKTIVSRSISSFMMITPFMFLLYAGHLYLCLFVAMLELMLVRELCYV